MTAAIGRSWFASLIMTRSRAWPWPFWPASTRSDQAPARSASSSETSARSANGLHLFSRLALCNAPSSRRIAIVVDQFEEIFTICRDEALRRIFIDNLLYAATIAGGQTVVILTLRADFYGKCAQYPNLAAALADQQELVGPMTEQELRRAIERPAQLIGCEFEPGLLERLIQDVKDQPGALPLMQYALLELWKNREGRRLTYHAYQRIGGLQGALENRANAVLHGFTEPERELCRRIFLRLTQPGEGTEDTKRRASFLELAPSRGDVEELDAVLHRLADARLITTTGPTSATGRTLRRSGPRSLGSWLVRTAPLDRRRSRRPANTSPARRGGASGTPAIAAAATFTPGRAWRWPASGLQRASR